MKIFSGIQPSGQFHIGNFLGAMKNWVVLQKENDCIFCIVDLHAITVDYPPKEMPQRILDATKDALAVGIDPAKSILFRQSDRPEHAELAWLLNTITNMGELSRMTQYKEKAEKHQESVGLFDYPVLMAADILIYKADGVPVGEDQTQHVELARDLARRFNSKFGQTFPEPKLLLTPTKRILGLDGQGKMSKSNPSSTYIALNDSPDTIRQKIALATTDAGNEPEISNATKNLIGLIEAFTGKERAEYYFEARRQGTIKYSEMKPELAEAIIKELEPIQKKRAEISDSNVKSILSDGAKKLEGVAQKTIKEIKEKMGLVI
ncbi:MAG: tryptophanyl-tRNA synthetase, tryptophanyl-tRNA synthetase [Candidatus Berkelbacteria bacterium]|nr:tryptophanyl-tRNA synthetase, tryptophanyl-tRNA synthetase [Candidatus Berkelbacteria bacterium]